MSDFILFFHWDMVFFLTKILSSSPSTPEIEYLYKIPVHTSTKYLFEFGHTLPPHPKKVSQSPEYSPADGQRLFLSRVLAFAVLSACEALCLSLAMAGLFSPWGAQIQYHLLGQPWLPNLSPTSKGYLLSRTITICNYLTYPCFPPDSRNLAWLVHCCKPSTIIVPSTKQGLSKSLLSRRLRR